MENNLNLPWRVVPADKHHGVYIEDNTGETVAGLYTEGVDGNQFKKIWRYTNDEDYARRIVASVSAVQGVPIESLETAAGLGIKDVTLGNLFSSRLKLQTERDALLVVMKMLMRSYVNTLENGRIRIIQLGGECDTVEKMEQKDPALKEARALIKLIE